MNSIFSLRGIRQVFDDRTVLDIERLDLSAGASYALLGPNGCGKTTLLHILAFLRQPTHGDIQFKGRLVQWSQNSLHALRRQVVLVDQHPIMFTTTVLRNVEYGLRMRGINSRERRKTAESCLDRVGMLSFAQRPAHKLSGGETQRVAIARALACSPDVILFDEPTASVDVENEAVIESIIKDIRDEKRITIAFATHKRLQAATLANERVFMFEGRLTGPGGENLLSGRVVRKEGRTVCIVGGKIELEVSTEHSGPAKVFIKPEGIRMFNEKQAEIMTSNGLHSGRILQMTAEGEHIKVLLDIGVPLRTLSTREEAAELGVLVGDKVFVQIGPDSAQVVQ